MQVRAAGLPDAPSIARVHIDSWRATYTGIVPERFLADLSHADRESWWEAILRTDPPAISTFVAETPGNEVVGFAGGGPEREGNRTYRAELYAIYVFEAYQRRGLGRLLTSALASEFLATGLTSMLLWVLEDNPAARAFYESLGGVELESKTITIGGKDLVEVSYGWRNLARLAAG